MTELCVLCFEGSDEWEATTLRSHLANRHGNEPAEVRDEYPDQYEELFADGELAPEWRSTGNGPESGTATEPDATGSTGRTGDRGENEVSTGDGATGRTAAGGDGTTGGRTTAASSPPAESRNAAGVDTRDEDEASGYGGTVDGFQGGKKWLMIGVGGAGNHIIDAILMRRDTLHERNDALAGVWEGGLADYGSINTNIVELADTYYAQVDREYDRQQLLTNSMIALGQHNHQGAGRRWTVGRKLMRADFDGETNALRDRWDISEKSLEASQAVMLVHSVTKGTGCGATPVLAENLREMADGLREVEELAVTKPILSSVVIPKEDEFGGSEMVRGVVGMAHLSRAVDGIIPFDNERLGEVKADISVNIDDGQLRAYNPRNYVDINKLLVAFLEAFTMSSTPQNYDREATQRINGEVFDVPDSFRPAEPKYPMDGDSDHQPAVIMAPVIGRSHASSFDRSTLNTLARTALFKGQLIDFEPDTAWGGSFMIYGPEEKMADIAPLVNAGELSEILSGEEFLDRGSVGPGKSIDLYVNQLVVPEMDSVHLWGVLWNPTVPPLVRMYEHVKELTEQSESQQAENVREVWPLVEALFGAMGRDAMG